jgi:hypothetical protein
VCARDHKWRLIDQTIYRKECDCVNFFRVVIAVYRLWLCTFPSLPGFSLDNLGFGSVQKPFNGINIYIYIFIYVYVYIYTHKCVCMFYMYIYIYIYIYTYIYI